VKEKDKHVSWAVCFRKYVRCKEASALTDADHHRYASCLLRLRSKVVKDYMFRANQSSYARNGESNIHHTTSNPILGNAPLTIQNVAK